MATPPYAPEPIPPVGPVKKTSPWVWVIGGCGALIVLAVIVFAVSGYLIARKVKQVAGGNPAGIVRMIAAMNPDVEVLSTDDATGKVTIRNKKDGKVVTMNFDDIKNGKFSIQEEGKDAVTIQAGGKDGQGIVDVKSADGSTAHIGAGSTKTPAWVPAYPGSSPQGTFSTSNDREETGSYTFTTNDGLEKVSKYYQDALKTSGFTVDSMNVATTGGVVTGKMVGDKRTVSVNLGSDGAQTSVTVVFVEKK